MVYPVAVLLCSVAAFAAVRVLLLTLYRRKTGYTNRVSSCVLCLSCPWLPCALAPVRSHITRKQITAFNGFCYCIICCSHVLLRFVHFYVLVCPHHLHPLLPPTSPIVANVQHHFPLLSAPLLLSRYLFALFLFSSYLSLLRLAVLPLACGVVFSYFGRFRDFVLTDASTKKNITNIEAIDLIGVGIDHRTIVWQMQLRNHSKRKGSRPPKMVGWQPLCKDDCANVVDAATGNFHTEEWRGEPLDKKCQNIEKSLVQVAKAHSAQKQTYKEDPAHGNVLHVYSAEANCTC